MAQKKFSQLPQDTAPSTTDSIPTYDAETVLTKRVLISDLITLFFNNVPAGANSPITRWAEVGYDHIASGCVWTGDSVGVNRNASMTAAVVYINGRRIVLSAVVARTFTASKDTYIDVLDNNDGTGTLVYTEVTNNAASPALAANSMRLGIIITGATTIAAAGSVNQGQEDKVLPIVSSIPYTVTDSLGNLICPRDPNRRLLGYRQIVANVTLTAPTSPADVTGLSCPFIPNGLRKVKVSFDASSLSMSAAGSGTSFSVYISDGTNSLKRKVQLSTGQNWDMNFTMERQLTPTSGLKTYKIQGSAASGNILVNATAGAGSTTDSGPAYIRIEQT